jgi:peroxiredoxin
MNVDVACERLEGEALPSVALPSAAGGEVVLDRLRGHWTVLYTKGVWRR